MRYRQRPIVVEAIQWFRDGDHPEDRTKWLGGPDGGYFDTEGRIVRRYRRPEIDGQQECTFCNQTLNAHGWVDIIEGGRIVCPGDYIITGLKGEYYPCKPDVFDLTYELADGLPSLDGDKLEARLRNDACYAAVRMMVVALKGVIAGSENRNNTLLALESGLVEVARISAMPPVWWWLSFSDGPHPKGVAIVEATDSFAALRQAHRLGINPGGPASVSILSTAGDTQALIARTDTSRLHSLEDLTALGWAPTVEQMGVPDD